MKTITFQEYQSLCAEAEKRVMTQQEHGDAARFNDAQPKECPTCGCQVFSPFNFNRVVHDVAGCALLAEMRGLLVGKTDMCAETRQLIEMAIKAQETKPKE